MNGWKKVRLGSICLKIGSGATPKGGATVYVDNGITFIRSQNVYNLKFDREGLVHISDEAAKKLDGVSIQKGDILLNITGDSVARTCVVPSEVLPARVNQHVAIVRPDPAILDYRFLNYYLASPYMQAYMLGLSVGKGASRNAMTKDMIANYEVPCPALEIQHHIASILSAYDNLIDNYRRQIKLLEEAAQRLYKEWFVDLRFPGYEHTKIVNGVPEGWRLGKLEEIVNINYGKDHKKAPLNGNIPVFGSGGLMRMCNKSLYSGESVLIPRKGSLNNIIYVNCAFWTVDTMFYTSMKMTHSALFVYFFLKRFDMYGMNIGAAVPSMTTKILNTLDILIPNKGTLCSFDNAAQSLYQIILKLQRLILLTQEARDRLLPKLMSGEIKV